MTVEIIGWTTPQIASEIVPSRTGLLFRVLATTARCGGTARAPSLRRAAAQSCPLHARDDLLEEEIHIGGGIG